MLKGEKSGCYDAVLRFCLYCPLLLGLALCMASAARGQRDGGDGALRYQLYQDAGRSQVWGDQGDALTIPSTDDGETSVDVFGVIPAGQEAPPGTYRDTVVITLMVNP
jgi:spore coat protein U-like protein